MTAKFDAAPILQALTRAKSWLLLGLGFSASIPFLLVGGTLGFWLRKDGVSLTLIGFFTGVGLMYGLKILWAPYMDRLRLLLLYNWLGQRRSYMLLAQVCVAAGLLLMAALGPKANIAGFLCAAVFVAFAAASQEVAIDAWRVEETESDTDQALNPSFYNFGYRTGLLVTNSLVLFLSDAIGWAPSYRVMAACMIIGVIATFACPRTDSEGHQAEAKTVNQLLIDPFAAFWREHAGAAVLILAFTALYRLADYILGPVVGPMYEDTGISNTAVAALRGSIGLAASYAGIALGGGCVLWLGLERALWLGGITTLVSKLGFAWMSLAHGNLSVFTTVLVADDLSNGVAETAVIAFMTRMTGRGHTLTHYALLYSVMAFTGKLLKMFSGQAIDALTPWHGLFQAYAWFFTACAAACLPAFFLLWRLRQKGVFSP